MNLKTFHPGLSSSISKSFLKIRKLGQIETVSVCQGSRRIYFWERLGFNSSWHIPFKWPLVKKKIIFIQQTQFLYFLYTVKVIPVFRILINFFRFRNRKTFWCASWHFLIIITKNYNEYYETSFKKAELTNLKIFFLTIIFHLPTHILEPDQTK